MSRWGGVKSGIGAGGPGRPGVRLGKEPGCIITPFEVWQKTIHLYLKRMPPNLFVGMNSIPVNYVSPYRPAYRIGAANE
jgi:hypothetical protein